MGMAKRILKHGWLIVFVVIIVIGYLQRDFLFPGLVDGEHPPEQETETVAVPSAEPPVQPEPDARPTSDRGDEVLNDDAQPAVEDQTRITEAPAGGDDLDLQDTTPQADDQQLPRWGRPPQEFGGNDVVMRTDRARAAFWSGDYDRAVILYRELIDEYDSNPDLYGELGNVHYAQGQRQEAAQAYYKAAERLLEHGQVSRAAQLNRVIRNLDAELAERLDRELAALDDRGQ